MKAKLIVIVALMVFILSISQAIEALTIPDVPTGIQFLASYNQENGTAYIIDENHPGFPGWNNLADWYDPDNLPAWASRIKPRSAMPQPGSAELEDTWGIFILGYIKDGVLVSNTVNPLGGGTVHYFNQDNSNPKDTWLVGISWGGNDTAVSFDEPGANERTSFTTLTDNVHLELWAVDMSDLDPSVDVDTLLDYDSSRRTAADEYTGWLDAAIRANGTKLLSGTSTYVKFDGALMGSSYFSGDTFAWFDLDETDTTALWNAKWGSEPLLIDPGLNLADIYMDWGLQFSSDGWDTYSRDFGGVNVTELCTGVIGDFVWEDLNKDGIQDVDEPGVPEVTVNLYICDDGNFLFDSTMTDANGLYLFDNLEPGDYYVEFVLPDGFAFTNPDQGNDDAWDSDADTVTGKTVCFTLPCEEDLTRDAGLVVIVEDECLIAVTVEGCVDVLPPSHDCDNCHHDCDKDGCNWDRNDRDCDKGDHDFGKDGCNWDRNDRDCDKGDHDFGKDGCNWDRDDRDCDKGDHDFGKDGCDWDRDDHDCDKGDNGDGPDEDPNVCITELPAGSDAYDVAYMYEITNTSATSTLEDVIVIDDTFGEIPGSPIASIAPGETVILTLVVSLSEETTNTVTVTGSVGDIRCEASDSTTITKAEGPPTGCRVTGGGNDTFDCDCIRKTCDDGCNNKNGGGNGNDGCSRYTFGGQAGSPTGCQPQPWGEWTHNHHSGFNASFTFHAGTASAPAGTEIDWITCSDPPCCLPARQAPTKQIDFGGVGTFKNVRVKNNSPLNWIETDKLYEFAVHIEDLGEPGSTNTKKNPLLGTAACPAEGRNGIAGDWANCGCPDFYRITIYNPDGDDYVVYGYIDGGNLQIHPSHPCK